MKELTYQHLTIELKNNYAILQLDRGKANALNQTLVDELRDFIRYASAEATIAGVLLTGKTHFFSGGVDLLEVYRYNDAGIRQFWGSFLQLAAEMTAFSKPLVAAITGHSPAGGCILACACDYRVMAGNDRYQIGLNEMAVGIAPRAGILELYAFWIGRGVAYQYLLEGKIMTSEQALHIGLVDELQPLEHVVGVAEQKLKRYLKLPQQAFRKTKQSLRASVVEALSVNFEEDLENLFQQLMSEESRAMMGNIVKYLQQKKE
jgi:enoyl-CoA hydratase/carnithine racemase